MFKRSTKITSLLVAAASMVSMVPAMAADRISTEDGKVYDAVAYKDGKVAVNGEIKDEDSAFYYSNGKFEKINEYDSGAKLEVYGEKYAKADDGDYFLDLTNGKVSDDEIDEDDEDSAASSLRSKIKKVDRYNDDNDTKTLTKIEGNKFGDSWYYTNGYELYKDGVATTSAQIFTNKDGKYVDADYNLGKIKVKVTAAGVEDGQVINIENTKDGGKVKKNGVNLTVNAEILNKKVLGQDKDNVYRLATIKFTAKAGNNDATITEVFGNEEIAGASTVSIDVVQKISKAQASDDVDDAKYAKSVDNYVLTNEDGELNDDVRDLVALLEDTDVKFNAVSGKLVAYKVKTNSDTDEALEVQSFTLKQKNGLYYTKAESNKKFDVEYSKDLDRHAVDVDVDGNIWFVDGGNIKKFDNKDGADKVYKVDGSMNALSVYNKENIFAWSTKDDVYSIIGSKAKEEVEDKKEETPAVKAGWNQAADGTWTFLNADGSKVTGWYNDNGTWYYLDPATGVMKTGWFNDNGTWYFLAGSGAMQTGWYNDNGTWYYLAASGAMQTGWINDNGTWYYCNASGAMLANTVVDGYVLGSNGAWIR